MALTEEEYMKKVGKLIPTFIFFTEVAASFHAKHCMYRLLLALPVLKLV